MLRTQSILPRTLAKWVSQVAASVGATLVATAIYAALPKPAPVDAPRPELTSGGKFAARAAPPVAYDGLDRMPLPQVTPVVAAVTLGSGSEPSLGAGVVRRVSWETPVPLDLSPDRAGHIAKPARSAARVDIRRAVPAEHHAPAAAETGPVIASASEPENHDSLIQSLPRVLPRLLPAALSGIEQAWAVTASTSGSLMAHVVPQIP